MSKLNVLIAGAGIAGPVLAYWLSHAGISSVIVERSTELRRSGQGIDIRGAALEVVKRMELEKTVRSHSTNEEGLAFVDSKGIERAKFGVDKEGGQSFTSDIEIMRGDLAQVFYDASLKQGNTEYIFGDYITSIAEEGGKAKVAFANRSPGKFDLVIAADGQGSKTRQLVFGEVPQRRLGQYTSFFTIPAGATDGKWGRWYNAPGGRCILLRPDNSGLTRAYLSIISTEPEGYEKLDVAGQKRLYRKMFADAGWEAERVLSGMDEAADFYMQEIVQIKAPTWHQGRVALLGDAGYCPSPISGMGTSLAIIGAYLLAGEISKHQDDHQQAFDWYEKQMRPYVDKAQKLPPGAPAVLNPQTAWGITVLYGVLGLAYRSGLVGLIGKLSSPKSEDVQLVDYRY
jgi:2-polyprenyl-6-methoxyphenol hydroxylase-like FAD-dependent oxidoreductase